MSKGIYQRGSTYWIRYAGADGKTVYESTGSKLKKIAEGLLTDKKKEIKDVRSGIITEVTKKPIPAYTFSDLKDKYMNWVNGRHDSARVTGYILNQTLEHFGNLPLQSFSMQIVEQYQTDLILGGKKNASTNKYVSLTKAMFTKALDWKMITEATLKDIRKVKLLPEDRRLRFISKEECKELIDCCAGHLKPIVITALNSGMRKSEVLSLEWDKHIDLKHSFILLDKTKNRERREIPINDTLRRVLQSITRRLDVPYVFFNPKTGQRVLDIKSSFPTACRKAKITDFRFHDLRHTFASHLVMAGVDLTTVSKLLGHKSIKMTLRYAHLAPAHLKNAVGILDNVLTGNFSGTIQKLYN